MFDQLIESTGKHDKNKKPLTFTISIIVHVVVVVVLIIMPLLFPESLSGQLSALTALISPPPPPPPAPPPPPPTTVIRVQRVQVDDGQFRAPVEIPKEIAKIVDDTPPDSVGGVVGGVPGGVPGGTIGGILGGVIGGANTGPMALPPPPPPEAPKPPQRIRVGGNVQQANLVRQVKPPYPPLARQARIQGAVILEAVINRQGGVEQLRVVSGHPLLVQAAMDAVRQWKYRPTLLNGDPVEVVTTITVNFNLSG